jgi:hypothetical protein
MKRESVLRVRVGETTGLRWPARATSACPVCDHGKRGTSMSYGIEAAGAAQGPASRQSSRDAHLQSTFAARNKWETLHVSQSTQHAPAPAACGGPYNRTNPFSRPFSRAEEVIAKALPTTRVTVDTLVQVDRLTTLAETNNPFFLPLQRACEGLSKRVVG